MITYYIYKHTSPSNKVYIGITNQTPSNRWGKNGSKYKQNKHFWNAIQKYGWNNFKHEILFTNLSKEQTCLKEQELIKLHMSNQFDFGYNCTSGGEHYEHSEESRHKQSIAQKNRVLSDEERLRVQKMGKANKGKKMSAETITKSANARLGHIVSQETRIKIGNANKISQLGKIVSEETKLKLSRAHKGKPNLHQNKYVIQYDSNNNFIKEWISMKEASRQLNICNVNISSVCRGYRKTAGGFIWKFKDEEQGENKLC